MVIVKGLQDVELTTDRRLRVGFLQRALIPLNNKDAIYFIVAY